MMFRLYTALLQWYITGGCVSTFSKLPRLFDEPGKSSVVIKLYQKSLLEKDIR